MNIHVLFIWTILIFQKHNYLYSTGITLLTYIIQTGVYEFTYIRAHTSLLVVRSMSLVLFIVNVFKSWWRYQVMRYARAHCHLGELNSSNICLTKVYWYCGSQSTYTVNYCTTISSVGGMLFASLRSFSELNTILKQSLYFVTKHIIILNYTRMCIQWSRVATI